MHRCVIAYDQNTASAGKLQNYEGWPVVGAAQVLVCNFSETGGYLLADAVRRAHATTLEQAANAGAISIASLLR